MHPGILPWNRGLDNLKRAILLDLDPAVTFHTIDEDIDAGRMFMIRRVPLYKNDTFHSIFLRHQKVELDGLIDVLKGSGETYQIPYEKYNKALGDSCDEEIRAKFPAWLAKRIEPANIVPWKKKK